MQDSEAFEGERPRLLRMAERVLGDPHEAQDVVQNAWLRLYSTEDEIRHLPAWLTTVTTRLCLDRLRLRTPLPTVGPDVAGTGLDPADEVILADAVGLALQVVLDRLTPTERVAFVLHDSFGFDFVTIAEILGRTPVATRKLASRARTKLSARPTSTTVRRNQADAGVVDAFLAAARSGDFGRLVTLLAPAVIVEGDPAAVALGTPEHLEGAHQVADFFNGAAKAALPAYIGDQPGAAWYLRGEPRVVFEFTTEQGAIHRIRFRAATSVLALVQRRGDEHPL